VSEAQEEASRSATLTADPLLRLEGVNKRFGAVQALTDINLGIYPGQVTALVGDNGAGKSTVIKTIAGIHPPEEGKFFWEGKEVSIESPRAADHLGIETVYQDLALADNLDIVANMFLGREERRGWTLDEDAMERKARETLEELRISTIRSIRQPVGSLSGGQRQAVAVAKAMLWKSKLVIMDEPTAALGVASTAMVLGLIRRLSEQGVAVLVVSHNLNDVFSVSDRLAVLYLGQVAAQGALSEFTSQSVVDLMTTGRSGR
jgi:ABC-type sugar transport system ATPase subunit